MPKILIVDDEPAILSMLKIALAASFEVETARSAAQGIAAVGSDRFDLVLTDMRMETPAAGYEVVRAACRQNPRPAVAILTAFPISPSEWRPSGADALLVKGSDILRLPETLQALMKAPPQKEKLPGPENVASDAS
ncbi:MAG: response regulator [Acidobacteria bacterium]|nr:response regulator [Acidobacteriota bacterium]